MLMNVAPPRDQFLLDLRGALADFLFELRAVCLGARRGGDHEGDRAENESGSDDAGHASPPKAGRLDLIATGVCNHCGRPVGTRVICHASHAAAIRARIASSGIRPRPARALSAM